MCEGGGRRPLDPCVGLGAGPRTPSGWALASSWESPWAFSWVGRRPLVLPHLVRGAGLVATSWGPAQSPSCARSRRQLAEFGCPSSLAPRGTALRDGRPRQFSWRLGRRVGARGQLARSHGGRAQGPRGGDDRRFRGRGIRGFLFCRQGAGRRAEAPRARGDRRGEHASAGGWGLGGGRPSSALGGGERGRPLGRAQDGHQRGASGLAAFSGSRGPARRFRRKSRPACSWALSSARRRWPTSRKSFGPGAFACALDFAFGIVRR